MSLFISKRNSRINFFCNSLLLLSAIFFLLFYFVVSFNNRPTYDDMLGIFLAKDNNIFQYVSGLYETISGRWVSWAYFYSVIVPYKSFQQIHFCFFIYYCITIFIFVFSLNKIIKFGILQLFHIKLDVKISIIYSILFVACFYFFTLQNIETWWYIGASFMYLQVIVFLFCGFSFFL